MWDGVAVLIGACFRRAVVGSAQRLLLCCVWANEVV